MFCITFSCVPRAVDLFPEVAWHELVILLVKWITPFHFLFLSILSVADCLALKFWSAASQISVVYAIFGPVSVQAWVVVAAAAVVVFWGGGGGGWGVVIFLYGFAITDL